MVTSNFSGSSSCSDKNHKPEPWVAFDQGTSSWAEFSHADQELLVKHFAPKVKYLALRLKSRLPKSVELGELIGAGTLGLMESFGKFNPTLGIKFDTYAENRIRGAMLDELRRLDWFPRALRRRVKMLEEAIHRVEQQTGLAPTEEALAEATGLSIKDVREGLEALQNQLCVSLDLVQDSLGSDEPAHLDSPYGQTAIQEIIEKMSELIEQLTPREKLVLSLYYTDELNMREVAEVMGITEGRVSQLHTQALVRLRKEFSQQHGELGDL